MATTLLQTPFEEGNQNQTTDWFQCIAFYQALAARYPHVLRFGEIGRTDGGHPLHAGVVSADGVFDCDAIRLARRPVFFNNNGIHPGEPEGIDGCMALVRDLCEDPARLAGLGATVLLFIPVYNVDGCLNRAARSRANQDGPELHGFRGNSLHLDLNRDFIKCDSLAAQAFNRFFTAWDPDVMVDTHTSNGADYPYTMTLIHTQADKLGGALGTFLRDTMLPRLFEDMAERGWPMCPYVNPIKETPDDGLVEFLETPRYSTGYAALHQTIGFMPETHMLKPFADRYGAMRALVELALAFTVRHGAQIRALRTAARAARKTHWPVWWECNEARPTPLLFKGYEAEYRASVLGNYMRLAYRRDLPWQREIPYYNHFREAVTVAAPRAYVVPQAWREVIARLEWNGVVVERLAAPRTVQARCYRIGRLETRPEAYEGHLFHSEIELTSETQTVQCQAGDGWIALDQAQARYAVETLEPQAHDSFFRWGFFDSVLERKEHYSDYVFEDLAVQLLKDEPELRARFEAWRTANPAQAGSQQSVLDFIYTHCERYAEPEWRRYPVLAVFE